MDDVARRYRLLQPVAGGQDQAPVPVDRDGFPGDRFVIGSIGPGTRSPTLSLGKDPRQAKDFIDYDGMVAGYLRQVRGLLHGGADVLLVETVFDLLQAKATVWACHQSMDADGRRVPVMVQVIITKLINTMLLGS